MSLNRSNSLSINTGATNNLFLQVPDQEPVNAQGRETDHQHVMGLMDIFGPEANAVPLFAAIPDNVQNALSTQIESRSIPPTLASGTADNKSTTVSSRGSSSGQGVQVSSPMSTPGQPSKRKENGPNTDAMQKLVDEARTKKANEAKARMAREKAEGGMRLMNDSAQQQTQQNTTTGGSGLFAGGSTTQQNQPQQGGGLFSNLGQQSQPQQSGGLFGTSNAQQANATGGGSNLFGGGNTQQNATSGGSNLFGGGNTQQNTTQGTSSLFGGNTQQNTTQGTSSLFGGANNANTQQSQPQGGGGGSIFGGGFGQNNSNQTSSLFSKPANQPSTNMGGMFGSSATQQNAQPAMPSLLGATQHAQINNAAPFGRLSMGQSGAAPSNNAVGAVKVDLENLRPTTRFEDCIDPVKQELEAIDKMIQQQESFCKQIEAFLPKHEESVNSIAPDVDFIKNKAEDVEQALVADAHGVDAQRKNTEKDYKDLERCQRIVTNLTLPQSYQYGNSVSALSGMYNQQRPQQQPTAADGEASNNYDTDLIGHYFVPMAAELQNTMNSYANNLSEIENHMRVIESSAVAQAQQLAQRQAGLSSGGPANSDDTVRELAGILRGFEQSILGVASDVGECREGVNELVLGRLRGRSMGAY